MASVALVHASTGSSEEAEAVFLFTSVMSDPRDGCWEGQDRAFPMPADNSDMVFPHLQHTFPNSFDKHSSHLGLFLQLIAK